MSENTSDPAALSSFVTAFLFDTGIRKLKSRLAEKDITKPLASSSFTSAAFSSSVSYIIPSLANDKLNAIPAIVINPFNAVGYTSVIT